MNTKYNPDTKGAIEFLQNDYILNAPLIEALRLNEARLINFDESGVVLMHNERILMLSLTSDDALIKYKNLIDVGQLSLFYGCTNPDKITQIIPLVNHVSPCYQMVYTLDKAPKVNTSAQIRLLDESHAQFIFENYSLKPQKIDSIIALLRRKYFYGAFVEGRLAGFVGRHQDGSMGFLEVLPEFKRQGIGRALDAFIIDVVLNEGRIPFAHVKTDNHISHSLQKSIDGMEFANKLAVWFVIRPPKST